MNNCEIKNLREASETLHGFRSPYSLIDSKMLEFLNHEGFKYVATEISKEHSDILTWHHWSGNMYSLDFKEEERKFAGILFTEKNGIKIIHFCSEINGETAYEIAFKEYPLNENPIEEISKGVLDLIGIYRTFGFAGLRNILPIDVEPHECVNSEVVAITG